MKKNITRKVLLSLFAVLIVTGITVFSYWLSKVLSPDKLTIDDIIVEIGIGGATGKNLHVYEALENKDQAFAPSERSEEDGVGEVTDNVVFELYVAWLYTEKETIPEGKMEKGHLIARINKLIIDDDEDYFDTSETNILASLFKIEVGYIDGEGNFYVPEDGKVLISPADPETNVSESKNKKDFEQVYVRVTFLQDPPLELKEKLMNKEFSFNVTFEVREVILVDE